MSKKGLTNSDIEKYWDTWTGFNESEDDLDFSDTDSLVDPNFVPDSNSSESDDNEKTIVEHVTAENNFDEDMPGRSAPAITQSDKPASQGPSDNEADVGMFSYITK